MKVKLVYETEIEALDCPTQYDILSCAWRNLQQDVDKASSMDDVADVFIAMEVDDSPAFPSFARADS